MGWQIEIDRAAERELDKLDPQSARRILAFLHDRVLRQMTKAFGGIGHGDTESESYIDYFFSYHE